MSDYPDPGSPMDPMDHPADGGHNDDYNPGRASVSDAAVGLAQAREDNKPSNKYVGNNQIATMGSRSALGAAARARLTASRSPSE